MLPWCTPTCSPHRRVLAHMHEHTDTHIHMHMHMHTLFSCSRGHKHTVSHLRTSALRTTPSMPFLSPFSSPPSTNPTSPWPPSLTLAWARTHAHRKDGPGDGKVPEGGAKPKERRASLPLDDVSMAAAARASAAIRRASVESLERFPSKDGKPSQCVPTGSHTWHTQMGSRR
jgi:hypothetical protein